MRCRSLLPCLGVLVACLAVLPGGKRVTAGSADAPAAVSSEFVLFARLDAKAIREGALFKEVQEAIAKANGKAEWEMAETETSRMFGVRLTDIDTVTVCVTEVPERGEPKVVVILTARAPFKKAGVFGMPADAKPDARGFYPTGTERSRVHFPDDKTAVVLSTDLAQKYLDGYAKNRTGWPLTAELSRAAAEHTAFAVVNIDKLPLPPPNDRELQEFAPLLAARTVTLTADLKGKELSVAARAGFTDAAAAGKAKDSVQKFVGIAVTEIEKMLNGKLPPDTAPFAAVIKETHRALKAAKVEASGSDVTLAGSYKADFDIGEMVAGVVKYTRVAVPLSLASNNLKQIALALQNYASTYEDRVLVHGVGANGATLKNDTDKPLLSWRVAILPYIEQDALYKQFKLDEPWDSEANKKLIPLMPKIFASVEKPGKPGYTHLQMVVGPNAMRQGLKIGNIPDGTSNTVAVIEAADPVIWTKPDDVMLPAKLAPGALKKKFGGQFPGGFHALMWDGSVRFVKDTVSEKTLGYALDPNDGMVLGSDW